MEALGAMGCSGFDVELRALVDVLLKDVCALAVRWSAALQREITASRSENSELRRRLHIMEQTLSHRSHSSHSSHSTQTEGAGRLDTLAGLSEPGGNEGLKKAQAECAKKTVNIETEPAGPRGGQWQRKISVLPGLKEEDMEISVTGRTQHRLYATCGDILHTTSYTDIEADCQFSGLKTECERKAEPEIRSPETKHSQDNSRDGEDDTQDCLAVEEACETENHSTQHGHHHFSHKTEEDEEDLERVDEEQEQFYTSHFMPPDLRLSSTLLPINSESTLSDCSMFASLEGNADTSTHLLNAECPDLAEGDSDPTNTRKQKGPRYICNICGKSLSSKYSLTVHFTMHTGERPYACAQCGKRFVNRSNLQIHQNIHTGAKPYVCTLCPKSFADPSPFGRHKRMHSRELQQSSRSPKCQFICNICGKSLSTKQGLSYHLTMHTGERPYTCTWCGKSFVLKHNLKIHQNIHTGAKPYACTLCPKSFADPSSLKKHQRMHES